MSARLPDTDGPWRLVDHDKLPERGFVYHWRSRQQPRLGKYLYRAHATAPEVVTWLVDDVRCADHAEAMRRLAQPPVPADRFERAEPARPSA